MTRLALALESELVREILDVLGPRNDIEVVANLEEGSDLANVCRATTPDVLLADPGLRNRHTAADLAQCIAQGVAVLVLDDDHSAERITINLDRGATGYLLSDCAPEELVRAVHVVGRGEVLLDPRVATTILSQWRRLRAPSSREATRQTLTPREVDVLVEMVEGRSTKAIARALDISVKTVETHKIRIFDKLGVRTHAQAVSVAIAHGLAIRSPEPSNGSEP
jgi:DNA-binding NarL/FixJ family response regulator